MIVVWDADIKHSEVFSKNQDDYIPRPAGGNPNKERYNPGSISDWTPGPAYVSENEPKQWPKFEENSELNGHDRRTVITLSLFESFQIILI